MLHSIKTNKEMQPPQDGKMKHENESELLQALKCNGDFLADTILWILSNVYFIEHCIES